jgi:hypothetical protein
VPVFALLDGAAGAVPAFELEELDLPELDAPAVELPTPSSCAVWESSLPVTFRFFDCWNDLSASCVFWPMTPSIGPGSNPLSFKASWTCFTLPCPDIWLPLRRCIMLLSVLPEFMPEESLPDLPIEPCWLSSELLLLVVPELVPGLLLPADHAGAMPTQVAANKIADSDRYFLFIVTPFPPIFHGIFASIFRLRPPSHF